MCYVRACVEIYTDVPPSYDDDVLIKTISIFVLFYGDLILVLSVLLIFFSFGIKKLLFMLLFTYSFKINVYCS